MVIHPPGRGCFLMVCFLLLAPVFAGAQDRVLDRPAPLGQPRRELPQRLIELNAIPADVSEFRFAAGSNSLLPEETARLDHLAKLLNGSLGYLKRVGLFGHAEKTESPDLAAARELGHQRAEAMKAALVARGVAAGRLVTASRGSEAFIVTRETPEVFASQRFVSVEDIDLK